jgi:hypothetical protein
MSQEDYDKLKSEIHNDLSKGYYKMSQTKIISLIGCTITACLTIFGGILYVSRSLDSSTNCCIQNSKDIIELKQKDQILDKKYYELNDKINQVKYLQR